MRLDCCDLGAQWFRSAHCCFVYSSVLLMYYGASTLLPTSTHYCFVYSGLLLLYYVCLDCCNLSFVDVL